ncbi:MAG: TrbI/VirB10 family protein [Verrucomicrobiae bacterium]|nr:TrbI/VirB10 family protein [Verrucomicrobiae bacterium]
MFSRILDFVKSPPGMMLSLVLVILAAFSIIGQERRRAELAAPTVPSLPDSDLLASSEIDTPVLIDRRDTYRPFTPVRKPKDKILSAPPPLPRPEPIPEVPPVAVAVKPLPVLIHSFSAPKETPQPKTPTIAKKEAPSTIELPYGTLIPCRLIHGLVAGQGKSPVFAVVTEDIRTHGQVVIPEGAPVHGIAADIFRDRLQAASNWHVSIGDTSRTLNAILIDRNIDPETNRFTFGAAGIGGKRLDKPHRHTGRIFLATAISGIARSLKDTSSGIFGNVPSYSPKNAGIEGASAVADRHAADLLEKARQNEKILEIPAGVEFYLYTQENVRFEPQAQLTPYP